MSKSWLTPEKISPPAILENSIGGHPLVLQTLVNRGFADIDSARGFLDPSCYTPSPSTDFPNLSSAADRITVAIQNKEPILIWGDFDVDGQTSTTLLVEALGELGANVSYHIPVRATEGHGIQLESLKQHLMRYPHPKLVLTCDTGISEHDAVAFAQARGVDVIITDHHELDETLPKAHTVINPHLLPHRHPLRTLPGVGVAYKLVEELFLREGKTTDSERYLDLVALGIVADVAEITGDTRYLLQLGLKTLRNTSRLGLQILYETADINPSQIDEGHIGFGIGPRLNALGRLSDANPIVEFFTTHDLSRARLLTNQLEGLNHRRKLLTDQVYQGALAQIERDRDLLGYAALVMAHPGWPNGVIGIVASRLAEQFGVPTILLNIQDDELARGSARGVEGIHIKDAIAAQRDLLLSFGGHAGAAGLSLSTTNISEFRTSLSRTIKRMTADQDMEPRLNIDDFVHLPELSLDLVDEIERLAPFGAGNPPLVLAAKDLKLINHTRIGSTQEHLRLVVEDREGNLQDVLWWRGVGETIPEKTARFDLAFIPGSNTFRGERKLQLQWVDYRLNDDQALPVETFPPTIEIIDYRNESHPLHLLEAIRSRGEIPVWAEGDAKSKVKGLDRHQLTLAKSLVVWTTPPSYWELQAATERVIPEVVYLFARDPGIDDVKAFLARLAGLVRHVLNAKDGITTLEELAANTAHREGTVRMGLFWLEAKGMICVDHEYCDADETKGNIIISTGTNSGRFELTEITDELKAMLAETAAFRKYLATTRIESLRLSPQNRTDIR